MGFWNERTYELLDGAYRLVEPLGLPLAIAAWLAVFGGALALGVGLRRSASMSGRWIPALAVGGASLAAHLLDYGITLRVSPTLALEANPIWRIAIDAFGVPLAKVYGLTGKILLAVLSFELFACYLIHREQLYPARADGFFAFWRSFGSVARSGTPRRWEGVANFFAFSFALLGPFFFYVALLNSLVNDAFYTRLPSMPLVLLLYLAGVTAAYFGTTYRAYARVGRSQSVQVGVATPYSAKQSGQ